MKRFMKLTALLLCMAMLTSTLAGCGFFGGNDTPEDNGSHTYAIYDITMNK